MANDVAPVVEPLVMDLTKLVNPEEGYAELVAGVCEGLYTAQKATLETYWLVGTSLHSLVVAQVDDEGGRNVSKVIKKLADDVHNVSGGILAYSDSTLRNMLGFRESFSEGQLHRLQALGLPISKALPMCINDVSDEQRDELITELETGALDTAAIPSRIQEIAPPETRDETRGGAGPFGTIKKLIKQIEKMRGLIEGDFTTYTSLVINGEGSEEDQIIDYKDKMVQFNNLLDSLNTLWQTQYNSYVAIEN